MAEKEIDLRRLVIKAFHMTDVEWGFYGACQRFGCTFHQVERTDRFVLNGVFIQLMNLSACENLHII